MKFAQLNYSAARSKMHALKSSVQRASSIVFLLHGIRREDRAE